TGCVATALAAFGALQNVDSNALVKSLTTYDYCRDEAASDEDKRVVAALWKQGLPARTPVFAAAAGVDLETALDGVHSLSLNGLDVSGIGPLGGILGLKTLGLRDNRIQDLTPLLDMSTLVDLDLANNQVVSLKDSLSALFKLNALERLNLGFNN